MALTLRLGKREVEALRAGTVPTTVLDKLEAAVDRKDKKRPCVLPVAKAIDSLKLAFGTRLILPPSPGPGWWAQQQKRINDLGLTLEDMGRLVDYTLAQGWVGGVRFETLIRNADVYLSGATRRQTAGGNAVIEEMTDL